jgi:hypothetical protein
MVQRPTAVRLKSTGGAHKHTGAIRSDGGTGRGLRTTPHTALRHQWVLLGFKSKPLKTENDTGGGDGSHIGVIHSPQFQNSGDWAERAAISNLGITQDLINSALQTP